MSKTFTYHFQTIEQCNMCGAKLNQQRVLGKRMNGQQGKNPRKKAGISTTVMKCKECDLIYSNPLPVPNSLQDHYGIPPESYWNDDYFKVDASYFSGEIHRLKQLLPIEPGMKSLDIGAGIGKAMISLERAGFDAYGFEPSEPFYQRAIERLGISTEKLTFGMMEEVEYPENTFDFITFGAVLEHLYDPSTSILKGLKWLKPNGIMHMEIPSANWLTNNMINVFYRLRGLDYVGNLSPMHEPFHLYEFGLKSFQKHAKLHGYEIAHHEFYVCETFLPKFLDPVIKPYMKHTDKGMQLAIWIRKR